MNINLSGKNVLVTGAAKRIGREIALTVAQNGGNVAIHYYNSEEEVQKTKAEIENLGVNVTAIKADLANYEDVRKMKEELEANFGSIDMIVNNAGWAQLKPFFQYERDEWQRELNVNLNGVINLAHVFIPVMQEKNAGKFINIVGDSARTGDRHLIISAAARSGTISFMKSLAKEVGRNQIQCNTVSLGMVDQGEFNDELLAKLVKQYPLGRLGTPSDVANIILFLLSDEANWITGQVFSVNGGHSMLGS